MSDLKLHRGFRVFTLMLIVAQMAILFYWYSQPGKFQTKTYQFLCLEESRWFGEMAAEYETIAAKLETKFGTSDHGFEIVRHRAAQCRRLQKLTAESANLDFRAIHAREMDFLDEKHRQFETINKYVQEQNLRLNEKP